MAHTLLTIGMITRRALMTLENNLVTAKYVSREYDDQFAVAGAKIGNVLNVRKPPRFIRTDGQALQLQDVTETSVPVTLTTQAQRSFAFTSQEQALDIDDYNERFLEPAMASLANQVDYDLLQLFSTVFNEVGTPGTIPNTLLTYLNAGVLLDNQAAPKSPRDLIIGSQMQATIVDALKGLFQASTEIAQQYKTGNMGVTGGFRWSMDQNVPTFTTGTQGGTPLVNGANQTGASIITNGWSNGVQVLNQGDIVQFAGCYAVNPQSRQIVQGSSGNQLANWVVTANVTSDGSGNATIPISGPSGFGIITAGPFQTASASPTAAGAVTVNGASATTSPRGLVFHKSAFTMACADLPLYKGVDMAERVADDQLGISIRALRAYDPNLDRAPLRLDFLYGVATLYPEMACRIAS